MEISKQSEAKKSSEKIKSFSAGDAEAIKIPTLEKEKGRLNRRVIGQEQAVEEVAKLFAILKSGIRKSEPGPIDIKFLAGPSGVGKTEIVSSLAEMLGEESIASGLSQGIEDPGDFVKKIIKLNGGEYQEPHQIARLIGSPPGYLGSQTGMGMSKIEPKLGSYSLDSNTIRFKDVNGVERGVVIILVDEAEKMHPNLHQAFLSILDKGEMEMSDNQKVDFSNALIFFTSNIGNEKVEKQSEGSMGFASTNAPSLTPDQEEGIYREAFKKQFPPEYRGRIEEFIVFKHLTVEQLKTILGMKLNRLEESLRQDGKDTELQITPKAAEWVLSRGYNQSEGARALDKVIKKQIREPIILASAENNLDGQIVVIDNGTNEPKLSFYLVDKPELEAEMAKGLKNNPDDKTTQTESVAIKKEEVSADNPSKEGPKIKTMEG